ncbi:MAG: hypothetical protein ACK5D5_08165 [Bacteroidota bacterium]|jgi:hypothetical protein
MKKITILGIGLFTLALISCKKDYTCECTTTQSGGSYTYSTTLVEVSKSAAKANCVSTKEHYNDGVAITGYSTTCNLK